MKVEKITILFVDEVDKKRVETVAVFANGQWLFSGPLYSRLLPALAEVWKVLRKAIRTDDGSWTDDKD